MVASITNNAALEEIQRWERLGVPTLPGPLCKKGPRIIDWRALPAAECWQQSRAAALAGPTNLLIRTGATADAARFLTAIDLDAKCPCGHDPRCTRCRGQAVRGGRVHLRLLRGRAGGRRPGRAPPNPAAGHGSDADGARLPHRVLHGDRGACRSLARVRCRGLRRWTGDPHPAQRPPQRVAVPLRPGAAARPTHGGPRSSRSHPRTQGATPVEWPSSTSERITASGRPRDAGTVPRSDGAGGHHAGPRR